MVDTENLFINCTDALIIMSENRKINDEEIYSLFDISADEEEDSIDIELSSDSNFIFDGNATRVLTSFQDRLIYAYACYNKDEIDEVIKKHVPAIHSINIPKNASTTKNYLGFWINQFRFSLEDFLLNDKYIVLSDNINDHILDKLIECNLISWNDVDICSAVDLFELRDYLFDSSEVEN